MLRSYAKVSLVVCYIAFSFPLIIYLLMARNGDQYNGRVNTFSTKNTISTYKERSPLGDIGLKNVDAFLEQPVESYCNRTDNNWKRTLVPPDGKLRLLVTQGCSGSSIVTSMIRKALDRHGYNVALGKSEVYKRGKNSMFDDAKEMAPVGSSEEEIIMNATVMLNQEQLKQGKITVFKWEAIDSIVNHVGQENILFGSMVRENVLDRMICSIRDCFIGGKIDGLGYPVFSGNGSRAELCFDRRSYEDGITKVHINPTKVVQFLHRKEEGVVKIKKRPSLVVTYEELMAFEYTADEGVWNASIDTWSALIDQYMGDSKSIDSGIIENLFCPMRNSRKMGLHEDVIQNYDEVFEALRKAGMGKYIRSEDGV